MPRQSLFIRLLSLSLSLLVCGSAQANCFEAAAARHGVSAKKLYVIALVESDLRTGMTFNPANNTWDYHPMGINSKHLPALRKRGVTEAMLKEPCQNIEAGAARYEGMVRKYGDNWNAVGAYHSETSRHLKAYAVRFCRRYKATYPADQIEQLEGC